MRTLLAFLLAASLAAAGDAWSGLCVGVADGDTITVLRGRERIKVRLYGIDCPESRQEFGQPARQAAENLVRNQTVTVVVMDVDRYGRTVGLVRVDGVSLNEALVRDGLAWVYNSYCSLPDCADWRELEAEARKAGKGLWEQENPMPPWDWRRGGRSAKPEEAPRSQAYRGNSSSRIFHQESCKNYNCANCTALFHSREAAIAAGYRPCGYCRP